MTPSSAAKRIIGSILGTSDSVEEHMERVGAELCNSRDIEVALENEDIERCFGCNCWLESFELVCCKECMQKIKCERDKLKEQLQDIQDAHRTVMDEKCLAPDEVHCTCVPFLRREISKHRRVIEGLLRGFDGAVEEAKEIVGI